MNALIVIKSTGEIIRQPIDKTPSLGTLQNAVGGYIQMLPLFETFEGEDCVAFCNEEGKLEGLPYNEAATKFWTLAADIVLDDFLVGDIVIVTGKEALEDL